jgi:hypothetical protein
MVLASSRLPEVPPAGRLPLYAWLRRPIAPPNSLGRPVVLVCGNDQGSALQCAETAFWRIRDHKVECNWMLSFYVVIEGFGQNLILDLGG